MLPYELFVYVSKGCAFEKVFLVSLRYVFEGSSMISVSGHFKNKLNCLVSEWCISAQRQENELYAFKLPTVLAILTFEKIQSIAFIKSIAMQ